MQYFGQLGEDAILWSLFRAQDRSGYYVEIGALDGKRFSNTYSFDLEGWEGVCVEAHPTYHKLLAENRPEARCIHAAVSNKDGGLIAFYCNSRGTLSTLQPELEGLWKKKYGRFFTGFDVQEVPLRTATSILDEVGAPREIDVVSIDTEGHDAAVLEGLDFERYRPRVLIIEVLNEELEAKLDALAASVGYYKARLYNSNVFYCRDEADVVTIAGADPDVALTHTPHPLDVGKSDHDAGPADQPSRPKGFRGLLARVFG